MKKKILAVVLSAMVVFSLHMSMSAEAYYNLPLDVGNHHSYGGGGYGSGSGGSHSSSGRYYPGKYILSNQELDEPFKTIISTMEIILIVTCVVILVVDVKKKYDKENRYIPYNANRKITKFINESDENFNSDEFLVWAVNLFIDLQRSWTERDWEKIRTLESEELFEQHNAQLQEYINLGRVNVIQNIHVTDAYLHKLVVDENFEHLTVSLFANMNDYIVDEKTGKVISGNKEKVFYSIYQLTFTRRKGVKTNSSKVVDLCPHCGAFVNAKSFDRCDFCGSIIYAGEFDWVLSNLESVDKNFVNDKNCIILYNKENKD